MNQDAKIPSLDELPLLTLPDEVDASAARRQREQHAARSQEILDELSLDLYQRWNELQEENGDPVAPRGGGDSAASTAAGSEEARSIINAVPDAIIALSGEGRVQSFNSGAERMFGWSAAEIIGQPATRLLAAEDGAEAPFDVERFVAGGGVHESLALRRDGSRFEIEVSARTVELDGGRYTAAVLRDISQRKQAERERQRLTESLHRQVEETQAALQRLQETQQQLVQAEKMASLGMLVAGVAHEINTPIGVAVTAASHLYDQMTGLHASVQEGTLKRSQLQAGTESSAKSASIILSNLKRAADLIQSFKRVAVDQSSSETRIIELGDYIHEVLTSLQPRLRQTPHRVEVDCPHGLRLRTVPGALSQILTNLIMNSLMHAWGEGETGTMRIEADGGPRRVRLVFRDDGLGIPADILPKIFDPFFTTKRGSGGSGLGLHVVFNLVHQTLRGSIKASSEPGQGARFVLEFGETPAAENDDGSDAGTGAT